jgi:hypothetical protein
MMWLHSDIAEQDLGARGVKNDAMANNTRRKAKTKMLQTISHSTQHAAQLGRTVALGGGKLGYIRKAGPENRQTVDGSISSRGGVSLEVNLKRGAGRSKGG